MAALSHPPGLPLILEGFLNLGGNFVPVIRLDRLFSLPEQIPGLNTHLLIVHGKDAPNALLVDRVEELLSIPVDAVAPVRQELSFNGCVIAEIQVGDKIIHLISPERVLLEQEAQRINELRAIVQQRLQNLETEQT
jgi:purine-binding chemotaxis protein CheW